MRGTRGRPFIYRAWWPRMHLPSKSEIADRLDELGLNPRDPGDQALVAAQLQAEQAPPPAPPAPVEDDPGLVLVQTSVPLADGRLEITARFYPTDTDTAVGESAHE